MTRLRLRNGFSDRFTISITGQITLNKDDLRRVLAEVLPKQRVQTANSSKTQDEPLRLPFTLKETAEILGIFYATAFWLVQRGLLKSSGALRCEIISKREIERFLKETSESA